VRSKTECIIADYFYTNNIPYRLEYPLYTDGRTFYPDFVFVNPSNGKIFYLETFGCMSDPDYVRKMIIKINEYSRAGLVLGDNFLALFESSDIPFDTNTFRNVIERALEK